MILDKYKMEVQDEYNIKLTIDVPKGKKPGGKEPKEGETSEKVIGYFGTLAGALQKIVNLELNSSTNTTSPEKILNALTALETAIELKYGNRAWTKANIKEVL